MNITFLIGNGFDLGVGLKTRFSDYFPLYIKQSEGKDASLKALADDIDASQDKWSYFEYEIGRYTSKFTHESRQYFFDQVEDFEKGFVKYLEQQEKRLSFDDTEKISVTMKSALTSFYTERNLARGSAQMLEELFVKNKAEPHVINFLNFNYTSVLLNCISSIPDQVVATRNVNGHMFSTKIGEMVYVHGTKKIAPIMGVNDEEQILNKELAGDSRFIRRIVKPLVNQMNRTNYDKDAERLIAQSSIIVIYGMSLGKTDKIWWQRVIEWLKVGDKRHLIIFDYDEKYNPTSQFAWLDKEDALIDTLKEYVSRQNINIESLRQRIHIAVHKNIFQMNLLNEEEAQKELQEKIERHRRGDEIA